MKNVLLICALVIVGALGLTAASLASKPPAPPGKDPCSHGNTGKPCRPDPQPTHGKDCDHHGKQGGVNEDHCKGETQPTTPTETQPTTPTNPTTPTETTPTNPTTPTQTTPTTSTPTPTTPGAVTPPPAAKPPASGNPKTTPKTHKPSEKPPTRASQPPGELPFTGVPTGLIALLGALLLGSGVAVRRTI